MFACLMLCPMLDCARYVCVAHFDLLPHTNTEESFPLLNRIREGMLRELQQETLSRVPVTLSIGVASQKADFPECPDGLVAMADRALYNAKENGKDQIVTFTDLRNKPIEST